MSNQMQIQSLIQEISPAASKTNGRWLFIAGILILLLGSIHEAATPIIFKAPYMRLLDVYTFIATGASVIFMGVLIIYEACRLYRSKTVAGFPIWMAGIYLLLLGFGAILIMPSNPFSYVTVILAVFVMILLIVLRRQGALK